MKPGVLHRSKWGDQSGMCPRPIVWVAVVLLGMLATGSSLAGFLGTFGLVPFGLPPEAGIAILLTIWPLFEWFPELQCIMASCTNTAIAGNIPPRQTTA